MARWSISKEKRALNIKLEELGLSSTGDAEKTIQYYIKRMSSDLILAMHRSQIKWIKDLNIKPESIWYIEGNIGKILYKTEAKASSEMKSH